MFSITACAIVSSFLAREKSATATHEQKRAAPCLHTQPSKGFASTSGETSTCKHTQTRPGCHSIEDRASHHTTPSVQREHKTHADIAINLPAKQRRASAPLLPYGTWCNFCNFLPVCCERWLYGLVQQMQCRRHEATA